MGSTIVAIGATIAGLLVLAGLVALVMRRFGRIRPEKATRQIRALPDPGSAPGAFSELGAKTAPAGPVVTDPSVPRLRETSAPAWAARVIVLNVPALRIGRSLENDLVLPDDPVSAEHCRLERADGSFRLIDLGSTNKTWVNGREVTEVLLKNGDELRVGPTTFVFERGA